MGERLAIRVQLETLEEGLGKGSLGSDADGQAVSPLDLATTVGGVGGDPFGSGAVETG
jgi:hypothetical protein